MTRKTIQELQAARLEFQFKKIYRFSAGVMSLREYLDSYLRPTTKVLYWQSYSSHRIHLEYIKLKSPIARYRLENAAGISIDVPKLVYDCYDLPERITEE